MTDERLKGFDLSAPFFQQLGPDAMMDVACGDGWGKLAHGNWNLLLTRRDMDMFCSHGMRPNRHWRLTDVKRYFGVTGSKEKVRDQIHLLCDIFLPEKDEAAQ